MPAAATPSSDRPQQPLAPLSVRDPALVIIYFFSGFQEDDQGASAVEQRVSAVFSHLAGELRIDAPFTPSFSPADRRYVRFSNLQWNPESRATLARFYVEPSQVWCIQLALPVHLGSTSLEQALAAWHILEGQLRDWLGDIIETAESDESTEWGKVYWGSSRLYWALSDETPVHYQAYAPQGHTGDYGTLWRLDEPAAADEPYQAAWLLLSPQAQNDVVAIDYILNGRFAIGEAYLCKAHYQAGDYARTARDLRKETRSVRREVIALLAMEDPSGFAPDQIRQARDDLRQYGDRIHRIAVAYSHLLFVLSTIDRLHLTVKTNLDNFALTAAEFNLWDHPASRSEIARLQDVLRQIEHDQRSRRASVEGFQTAIETIRARLDLIDDRLSADRLEIEQEEARRSKRWDIVVAILGLVLGASQVVVLRGLELVIMVLLLTGVALGLALVLVWRRLRRADKHRE